MEDPKRSREAEAAFRKALAREPDWLAPRENLVAMYFADGRVEDAIRTMHEIRPLLARAAVYKGVNRDSMFREAGRNALKLGRPTQAVRYYDEAVRVNPGDAEAARGLEQARAAVAKLPAGPPKR
jgi:Flp pilus assembly protein TadD